MDSRSWTWTWNFSWLAVYKYKTIHRYAGQSIVNLWSLKIYHYHTGRLNLNQLACRRMTIEIFIFDCMFELLTTTSYGFVLWYQVVVFCRRASMRAPPWHILLNFFGRVLWGKWEFWILQSCTFRAIVPGSRWKRQWTRLGYGFWSTSPKSISW